MHKFSLQRQWVLSYYACDFQFFGLWKLCRMYLILKAHQNYSDPRYLFIWQNFSKITSYGASLPLNYVKGRVCYFTLFLGRLFRPLISQLLHFIIHSRKGLLQESQKKRIRDRSLRQHESYFIPSIQYYYYFYQILWKATS